VLLRSPSAVPGALVLPAGPACVAGPSCGPVPAGPDGHPGRPGPGRLPATVFVAGK